MHIALSCGYKLVYVDDKFCQPFKSNLGKDAIYKFINSMVEESKSCNEVMKKYFNKNLIMTKEDDENFDNSPKCWICENTYVDGDVKVRDHCHITRKYRDSAQRGCNINVKLNHNIPIAFHNLKNYDSHRIM